MMTSRREMGGLLGSGVVLILAYGLHLIFQDESPIARMFIIIGALFFGFKVLVVWTHPLDHIKRVVLFWLWPGMNPKPFQKATRPGQSSARQAFVFAGFYLICAAALLVSAHAMPGYLLTAAVTCVGLSLFVHFGIFGLIRAAYLATGLNVPEMFSRPWNASTFSAFWGQRWNRPFMELSSLIFYRPLQRILGRDGAIAGTFIFSGLVHEMAISLPVQAGYGGPFGYFILHGLFVIAEKRMGNRIHPRVWRVVLWAVLILPLPFLFHPAFIEQILFPLIGLNSTGGLS